MTGFVLAVPDLAACEDRVEEVFNAAAPQRRFDEVAVCRRRDADVDALCAQLFQKRDNAWLWLHLVAVKMLDDAVNARHDLLGRLRKVILFFQVLRRLQEAQRAHLLAHGGLGALPRERT